MLQLMPNSSQSELRYYPNGVHNSAMMVNRFASVEIRYMNHPHHKCIVLHAMLGKADVCIELSKEDLALFNELVATASEAK